MFFSYLRLFMHFDDRERADGIEKREGSLEF